MAKLELAGRGILKALDDPASCTNDILLSVKGLLSPIPSEQSEREGKENVKGTLGHSRARSLATTTKVTATARKTKAHARQLTVVDIKQDVLVSPQEKVNFAFQVVNTCIKNLSQLAKEHVLAKRAAGAQENGAKSKTTVKSSPPKPALGPKSPNPKRHKAIDESCKPARPSSPAASVAACACAALSFLRSHYTVSQGKDSTYQVENGILAVIGKCIDLELEEVAAEQLLCLKDRLSEHLGNTSAGKQALRYDPSILSRLFDFPTQIKESPVLNFAVKLQQHAWQILQLSANVAAVSACVNQFLVDANNKQRFDLLRHWSSLAEDRTKGARQLLVTSRLMLQLSTTPYLSSQCILTLRCSAFSLQLEASQLGNGISNDEARDIASKLARCLDAIYRSVESPPKTNYTLATSESSMLLEVLDKYPACMPELAVVRRILGQLAAQAGDVAQAKRLSKSTSEPTKPVLEFVRLTANGLTSGEHESLLKQAVIALQQALQAEKSAADRLLVEVVGLRRAIHKAVSDKNLSGAECLDAAAACLTFLRNYLGCYSSAEGHQDFDVGARLRVGKRFARPFISTIIVCCLHYDTPGLEVFAVLSECCGFVSEICGKDETFTIERFNNQAHPESSIFVMMSKLCHRIWNQRTAAKGFTDDIALAALQTSIKALEPWTREEKEAAGHLQEIRHLIDAHVTREEWQEAYLTFKQFLNECSRLGILEEVAIESGGKFPTQLRHTGSLGSLIFRCMRSFVIIALRMDLEKPKIAHDELDLEATPHGLLLEWQLEQLAMHSAQQRAVNGINRRLVQLTFERLLEIYDQKTFPIRRMRVAVAASRLLHVVPDLCNPQDLVSAYLASPSPKRLAKDAQLADQYWCLEATLRASLALLDPHADDTMNDLKTSVETFESRLSSATKVDDIDQCITDVDAWYQQLEAIADLYALRRDFRMEAQSLEVMLLVLSIVPDSSERRCEMLCRLAVAYISLGYTGKARNVLDIAESDLSHAKASAFSRINWRLAGAEYCLAVHNLDGCKESLQKAAELSINGGEESFVHGVFAHAGPKFNVKERKLVARAAYINGMLELKSGQPASALRLCTTAKCMLFKIWSSLEQIIPRDLQPSSSPEACPSSDEASAMEDVLPVVVTRSYSHLASMQLRELVPNLLEVAMLELKIHDFRGAYHEAFAALKHANKIANYIGAGVASVCDTTSADLYTRSLPTNSMSGRDNKLQEARLRINMVDEELLNATQGTDLLYVGLIKARLLELEEEPEDQLQQLQSTMEYLKVLLTAADNHRLPRFALSKMEDSEALADQLAAMKLNQQHNNTTTIKTTKAKSAAAKPTKKGTKAKRSQSKTAPVSNAEQHFCIPLEAWHAELLQKTALASLEYHADPDMTALTEFVQNAGTLIQGNEAAASQSIASGRLLLHRATQQMAADITFNAVHDSITVVPPPQQPQHYLVQQNQITAPVKTPRKGKTATSAKVVGSPAPSSAPAFVALLHDAYEILRENWTRRCLSSSMSTFRKHSLLISDICLKTSACTPSSSLELVHPLVCAYQSDAPGIRARHLNHEAGHPDVEKLSKVELRGWPIVDERYVHQEPGHLERSVFQAEFIDIVPSAWNVVSMSLTDNGTAMKLARYRSGQSPFILRIPFAHRESDDPDDEALDMSVAYERLRSIIKQHEFTPVEAGVTDQPEFKRKWWQKKHELDTELRVLLHDVEEQWFSAVKGVFSSEKCDPQALSDFQARLQTLLIQQCPTKKGKGKGKPASISLNLETRVLELFIGLGDPSAIVEVEGEDGPTTEVLAETSSMCDGVHDLIRLILENLQFNGESVAIDEVDMDNVIVKVIDALKDYYTATADCQADYQHTVLILDNQLHGFPWESLPCLKMQSVSRLPSLADLRDRIVSASSKSMDDMRHGRTIARSSGTSLLNPSGDLSKTAQRFQPWLNKLPPEWAHLRKAPDDDGWRDMLTENDLFLYVGHGSTSQYVRPRVVKRLGYQQPGVRDLTCAVSWLIGCSSVAVEDLGEYEPSGMVLSYLAAGSPAVLGALWDVGDIDADHFSITAGDYWGLWDETNKGLDVKLFPARKRISEEKKAMGRNMSMCEAVTRSRGGCKLPYLNGAAFVVYGIPVFLD